MEAQETKKLKPKAKFNEHIKDDMLELVLSELSSKRLNQLYSEISRNNSTMDIFNNIMYYEKELNLKKQLSL